jgi:hypothetical protein
MDRYRYRSTRSAQVSDDADSTDGHSHIVFITPSSFLTIKKRDRQIAVSTAAVP